jgi:UDP-glucose 4-epimerase
LKTLVTGGAGFIGSNIVDKLISQGHEVTVIDNESSDASEVFYWNSSARNHKLDITDFKTRGLYEGIDVVFHVAAEARIQPAIINPILAIKTNVLGTGTVLQFSREGGVKKVIYSASSSAYGMNKVPNIETQLDDCLNPYSVSKVSGEHLCRMYTKLFGLKTIILRYFNVYGYRQPVKGPYAPLIGLFAKQKKEGKVLTIVGDGEQRRDYTNVADVVDANILAAFENLDDSKYGELYNIGTGLNFSVNEIANLFDSPIKYIPERLGEARETLANIEKARNVLKYNPQFKLIDFIRENYI